MQEDTYCKARTQLHIREILIGYKTIESSRAFVRDNLGYKSVEGIETKSNKDNISRDLFCLPSRQNQIGTTYKP